LKNSPAKWVAAQQGCGLTEGDSPIPDRLRSNMIYVFAVFLNGYDFIDYLINYDFQFFLIADHVIIQIIVQDMYCFYFPFPYIAALIV
jgi:hypothetical protein